MIRVRQARSDDFERIFGFYRAHEYRPAINTQDVAVIAEDGDEICGVVRLCIEHGTLVLRGMRVRADLRRQGLGTALLRAVEPLIGGRECFCIPYRHLLTFYAQIGFEEIAGEAAPEFLRERCEAYRIWLGLDVTIMRRPASPHIG